MYYKFGLKHYYYFRVYSNKYYYLLKKRKLAYLSYIDCVCLVSAVYNSSLQLQMLGLFVVVLWLCNVL